MGDTIGSFLLQLLQSIYFCLLGESIFEQLRIHQEWTMLSFYQHHILDNILMGKKPVDRGLFLNVPHNNTLIIRTRNKHFPIRRDGKLPHPTFMPYICPLAKPCWYFPQLNGLIPRTRDQQVTFNHKINKGYIMIMTIESFIALIIVMKIPKFDVEIRRTRNQIFTSWIIIYTVHRIYNLK